MFQARDPSILLAQAFVSHHSGSAVSVVAHIAKFTVASEAVPNQLGQLLAVVVVLCAAELMRQFVEAKARRLPVLKQGVHQCVRLEPQNAL